MAAANIALGGMSAFGGKADIRFCTVASDAGATELNLTTCVYRKPKPERNDDEARPKDRV
jgi:hypothetical protein